MIPLLAAAVGLSLLGTGPVEELVDRHEDSVAQVVTEFGSGTGFVVGDGLLVTNFHVIAGADGVEALFEDGEDERCDVVDASEAEDLALLACDTDGREPLPVSEEDPGLGADVVVLGYPGDEVNPGTESLTVTSGVVSRLETAEGWLQTDAALNPGNSGGPVLDLGSGEVIGVAVARNDFAENTGFAVRAETLRRFLDDELDDTGGGPFEGGDDGDRDEDDDEEGGAGGGRDADDDSGSFSPVVVLIAVVLAGLGGWGLYVLATRGRGDPALPKGVRIGPAMPPSPPEADVDVVLVGSPHPPSGTADPPVDVELLDRTPAEPDEG